MADIVRQERCSIWEGGYWISKSFEANNVETRQIDSIFDWIAIKTARKESRPFVKV